MIVVSNTSPLTSLAAIGQLDLMNRLYGQLHIAEVVWEELNAGGYPWPGAKEVAQANWISRHQVSNRELVLALIRDLDQGEAESIALAIELEADLLILDEREGRRLAKRFGLNVTGVLGVLLEAKAADLIQEVRPLVQELRDRAGFYLSEDVQQLICKLAGEVAN